MTSKLHNPSEAKNSSDSDHNIWGVIVDRSAAGRRSGRGGRTGRGRRGCAGGADGSGSGLTRVLVVVPFFAGGGGASDDRCSGSAHHGCGRRRHSSGARAIWIRSLNTNGESSDKE